MPLPDALNGDHSSAVEASLGWRDTLRISTPDKDPRGIEYELLTWDEFLSQLGELSDKVVASEQRFDGIISPLRGGALVGIRLSQRLGVPLYVRRTRLYEGIQANAEARDQELKVLLEMENPPPADGKYAFADDVNDTTKTFNGSAAQLRDRFGIQNLLLTVIHEKPGRRANRAAVSVRDTDRWIVYPFENSPVPIDFDIPAASHSGLVHVHYDSWEHFEAWLPSVMVTEKGYTSWRDAMKMARRIGFKQNELPSLQDTNFAHRLLVQLNARNQAVTGELPDSRLLNHLMPKVDWDTISQNGVLVG